MVKAYWKGKVLAESDTYEIVEGNIYFPPENINKEFFKESSTHTSCHWKGLASYYNIQVDGEVNKDAAWYYPNPSPAARHIKDYIAFWKGVKIEK